MHNFASVWKCLGSICRPWPVVMNWWRPVWEEPHNRACTLFFMAMASGQRVKHSYAFRQYINLAEGSKGPVWSAWTYSKRAAGNVKSPSRWSCVRRPSSCDRADSLLPTFDIHYGCLVLRKAGKPFSFYLLVCLIQVVHKFEYLPSQWCRDLQPSVYARYHSRTWLWGWEWDFFEPWSRIPLHKRS